MVKSGPRADAARDRQRDRAQRDYFNAHGVTLLADYLAEEQRRAERIVYANDHWMVLVPFWAIWPFEALLVSRRPARTLPDLDDAERDALADAIHHLTVRYDNLFHTSFPYSMGFHQQPTMARTIRTGTCTRTSTRPCCARRRCASSWWGTRCWARPSATSPPSRPPPACAISVTGIIHGRQHLEIIKHEHPRNCTEYL
jgi:hypothetical protein